MAKLLKILAKLIGGILEWTLILLIFTIFAIRTSPVQTFLARQATDYLSKELKTTFRVEKVSILFFHKVALDGIFVLDQHKDTLADIQSLYVTIHDFSQTKNLLTLNEVALEKGKVKIAREAKSGDYNYWFIQDYFDSGKPKKEPSKPIDVLLKNLRLTQVTVHYDDYRKTYSSFGMDYDHLKFKNVYLFASNITSKNGVLKLFMKHISFREKGGFELDKFSSLVQIDSVGLHLDNLRIKTPYSRVHMGNLDFGMNEIEDFQTFEDSVELNAQIKTSIVSLKDVSYFGTALEGMDEKVILSGNVSKKIKNLRVENLQLFMGKKTKLEGTINLPDFREFDQAFFQEKLSYAYIDMNDLARLKLPKDAAAQSIYIGQELQRLNHFEAKNLKVDGFYSQFVVEAERIQTALGSVKLDHGIMFTENPKNNSFTFEQSSSEDYDIKIDSFDLGKFIDNRSFGKLAGKLFLNGEIFPGFDVHINHINGNFSHFEFMDYAYKDIEVNKASYMDELFTGDIDLRDPNATLAFDGSIFVGKKQDFQFEVTIQDVFPNKINWIDREDTELKTKLVVNMSGEDINSYSGKAYLEDFYYRENKLDIRLDYVDLDLQRSPELDQLKLLSNLIDIQASGKVDLNNIGTEMNNQFATIFPALFQKESSKSKINSHFTYDLTLKNINPLLAIFAPELKLAPQTKINGKYHENQQDFNMEIQSKQVSYADFVLNDLSLKQAVIDTNIEANYVVNQFIWQDSIRLDSVYFKTNGSSAYLSSNLGWNPNSSNEAFFDWKTNVNGFYSYDFQLLPSYFGVNEHRWNILKEAQISLAPKNIEFHQFKLEHDQQYITLEGLLSEDVNQKLAVFIHDLELNDLGTILNLPVRLDGKLDGNGYISDPFNTVMFDGKADVQKLFINGEEIGDVNVNGAWNKTLESIHLDGDLFYKNNQTFHFDGDYFLKRIKNPLDFRLQFDRTDIQFANAFLDPQVVSSVRGLLEGQLNVFGSFEEPIVEGNLELNGGNAKVEMFGVNFGVEGNLLVAKNKITIRNAPIYDEEGNMGSLTGSISHENFDNWSFGLNFNLNEYYDEYTKRFYHNERFLVLNTNYKEGDIYYGRGYAAGTARISGFADNLDIAVNMKTLSGSTIEFPMYGNSELTEDEFITFVKPDNSDSITSQKPKIDFTGVNLDLNFEVNPETQLKVIFNELTNDVIEARGRGNIRVRLDNLGEVNMDGTFTVKSGIYNFAFGVIKQPFYLEEGGTIGWTGDPYEANLNIKTYVPVNANISEITEIVESKQGPVNQRILCYLNLSGQLSEPLIQFDIQAPDASESGKAAITRIKSNSDELNRQFFALMVQKKFLPLQGSSNTGGNTAFDILSTQINQLLDRVSQDVRLNVNMDNDAVLGESKYEFGVSKNFLDNRLIVKGKFGVENNVGGTSSQTIINDVNVEYLLDENGNFRVNLFNESNDFTVIQEKDAGLYTQGVGIQYQEEFGSIEDFQLFQKTLNLFRKKKRKVDTNKSKRKPIPENYKQPADKPEE